MYELKLKRCTPAKSLEVNISSLPKIAENTGIILGCRAEKQSKSMKDTSQMKQYASISPMQGSGSFSGSGNTGTFKTAPTETPYPTNRFVSTELGQPGFNNASNSNAFVTAKFLQSVADLISV